MTTRSMLIATMMLTGASVCLAETPARANCSALATTCTKLSSSYNAACANSMPDRSRYPAKWLQGVLTYTRASALFRKRAKDAAACVACGKLYAKWQRDCDRRKGIVAEGFKAYVASKATHSTTFKTQYDSAMKRRFYRQAADAAQRELADVRQTVGVAKVLGVPTSKLTARMAALGKMFDAAEAERRKALAAVRCPTSGRTNAKHFATVKAFFVRDPAHAKALRQLRVVGRSSSRYDPLSKTTTETLPLTGCLQTQKAKSPRCFVFELSVQRTKVRRGKWSPWDTVLVGAQREMLCANLE